MGKRTKAFEKANKASNAHLKALEKANQTNEWNKKERAKTKLQADKADRKYYRTSANSASRMAQQSAKTKKKAIKLGENYGIYSLANANQAIANTQKNNIKKVAKNKTKDIKQDRKELNNIKKSGKYATTTRKKTTRRK